MHILTTILLTTLFSTFACASTNTTPIRQVSYKDVRRSISTLSQATPSTVVAVFGTPYASVLCEAKNGKDSYYELRYPTKASSHQNIDDSFTNSDVAPIECTPLRFYKKNSYKLGLVLTDATSTVPLNCQYSCQKDSSNNEAKKISIKEFTKTINKK